MFHSELSQNDCYNIKNTICFKTSTNYANSTYASEVGSTELEVVQQRAAALSRVLLQRPVCMIPVCQHPGVPSTHHGCLDKMTHGTRPLALLLDICLSRRYRPNFVSQIGQNSPKSRPKSREIWATFDLHVPILAKIEHFQPKIVLKSTKSHPIFAKLPKFRANFAASQLTQIAQNFSRI